MNTFKRKKKKITYTYKLPTDSLESLPHGFKFQKPIQESRYSRIIYSKK